MGTMATGFQLWRFGLQKTCKQTYIIHHNHNPLLHCPLSCLCSTDHCQWLRLLQKQGSPVTVHKRSKWLLMTSSSGATQLRTSQRTALLVTSQGNFAETLPMPRRGGRRSRVVSSENRKPHMFRCCLSCKCHFMWQSQGNAPLTSRFVSRPPLDES